MSVPATEHPAVLEAEVVVRRTSGRFRRGTGPPEDYDSQRVAVNVTHADIEALEALLRGGWRPGNEDPDTHQHLQGLIPKPWGQEYRIYVDDFLDVWHLEIEPEHATSMHTHPRKITCLMCVAGSGVTHTLGGEVEVTAGSVLHIARGAFHSTENTNASETLSIIEVETPRNKYDLLRLRDGYNRAGKGYESTGRRVAAAPRKVAYLPNTWMRRSSPCGRLAFDIVSGMDVHYRRRSAGNYLVPLGLAEMLAGRMTILTDRPDDTRSPNLNCYYLSIRRLD
jgi:mannose-6-phosphate isomerase-like protein (cupin superfamily)